MAEHIILILYIEREGKLKLKEETVAEHKYITTRLQYFVAELICLNVNSMTG